MTYLHVTKARADGRGLDHEHVSLRSRIRPEVYTLDHDKALENEPGRLDRLVKELERLDARNLPRDRVFLGRRCRVHAKLFAYWTGGSYPRMDRMDLKLGVLKVGVRL
ncbi:hypothetical protein D3C71_1906430 [compost metagenome]